MSQFSFPDDAVWIGSAHPFDLHEAYLCFRSPADWQVAQPPRQAELFISADSRYKAWLNGHFIGRGPARSHPHQQQVDRLEVTPYVRAGANSLAVQVYQPGYSHFSYVHRGAAGLLVHLTGDGQSLLTTSPAWQVRRDPSFAATVPRVSIYGSGVEARDMRLAENWLRPDDDHSAWDTARLVAPLGGPPWSSLRLREVPLSVERDRPLTLLEVRRGPALPSHLAEADAHTNLRRAWLAATPVSEASLTNPDEAGWYQVDLAATETAAWLFDLGRDYTGQGWADISGASGREQLAISYQEKIRAGSLVISDPSTYCRVRLTDHFQLRPGDQQAETFALRGGRYLIFQLTGPTGPDFRFRPQARVAEYPLEISRPLTSRDPLLTQIITMCETTLQACLQDGFVDCTWRESSQWLGDALPQSLVMAAVSDDLRPLRQVLEMAAAGAYPDGVLPSVLPGEVHAYTVVDYNFTWVELLHLYHRLSGDTGLVGRLWPVLVKLLERFHQDLTPAGLIVSQPGRRLFLDWAPLCRAEPNAVYNFRYLLALQKATELAETASQEQRSWSIRAEALQRALRTHFWRAGRWADAVEGSEGSTFSQLTAALAILTRTATTAEVEPLFEAIIARSLDLEDGPAPGRMVLASPFMHHYLFEALGQHQRDEAVIEIIRRRWGRWVEAGYPTTWENWNVDFPDGSQCHAFSAHPRYHLAEIAKRRAI